MTEKDLTLKCPVCKTILPYGGYPSNPIVSTIMCLSCGYVAPGYAFHRICDVCGKDFDVDDVTTTETDKGFSVICNVCKKGVK